MTWAAMARTTPSDRLLVPGPSLLLPWTSGLGRSRLSLGWRGLSGARRPSWERLPPAPLLPLPWGPAACPSWSTGPTSPRIRRQQAWGWTCAPRSHRGRLGSSATCAPRALLPPRPRVLRPRALLSWSQPRSSPTLPWLAPRRGPSGVSASPLCRPATALGSLVLAQGPRWWSRPWPSRQSGGRQPATSTQVHAPLLVPPPLLLLPPTRALGSRFLLRRRSTTLVRWRRIAVWFSGVSAALGLNSWRRFRPRRSTMAYSQHLALSWSARGRPPLPRLTRCSWHQGLVWSRPMGLPRWIALTRPSR
jgi:hypothetical protein